MVGGGQEGGWIIVLYSCTTGIHHKQTKKEREKKKKTESAREMEETGEGGWETLAINMLQEPFKVTTKEKLGRRGK